MVLTPERSIADRQPVHTVYGGAQLFKAETPGATGHARARADSQIHAGRSVVRSNAWDCRAASLRDSVFERTVAKLEREPVEDFRIDFEDGYGYRSDAEEDGHAQSAAQALARAAAKPGFPPFIGIRIKPFTVALRARASRTLDLFFNALFAVRRFSCRIISW